MKKNNLILILLFALIGNLYSSNDYKEMFKWDYPEPEKQLQLEGKHLIPGKGGIFVPCMTDPQLEPLYSIYQGDEIVEVSETGSTVFLEPGTYTLRIGSGTISQKFAKEIEVLDEHVSLVDVEWSGLTVRLLDDLKNYWEGSYEVFDLRTGESYGVGKGEDESVGNRVRTWLLPPGVYKIVKLGENFNTLRNYITVRILPKDLVKLTIIVDDEFHNFIGGGIEEEVYYTKEHSNLRFLSNIDGYFTFDQTDNESTGEDKTRLALSSTFEFRTVYETNKHYYSGSLDIEEGINKESSEDVKKYIDKVQFRNMYIFRLWNRLGPYARLDLQTSLFEDFFYFDDKTDITKIDEHGNLILNEYDVKKTEISPAFYPLSIKEGIGINMQLIRGVLTNLSVRLGLGFRQTITNNNFAKSDSSDVVFYKLESHNVNGLEISYTFDKQLFNNIFLYSEYDAIKPFSGNTSTSFDWTNKLSFHVSQHISVDYTFNLSRDASISEGYDQSQRILLNFSFSLF